MMRPPPYQISMPPVTVLHDAQTGGILLRVVMALGLGAMLLSFAVSAALSLQHSLAAQVASEQASQRAYSAIAALGTTIAEADDLPAAFSWQKGADAASLLVNSRLTGHQDEYAWHAPSGAVMIKRSTQHNRERLVDAIVTLQWQPDITRQGGWLGVSAASDTQSLSLPAYYRQGCRTEATRACLVAVRYIAHPQVIRGGVADETP